MLNRKIHISQQAGHFFMLQEVTANLLNVKKVHSCPGTFHKVQMTSNLSPAFGMLACKANELLFSIYILRYVYGTVVRIMCPSYLSPKRARKTRTQRSRF